jgi:hypothetical protein
LVAGIDVGRLCTSYRLLLSNFGLGYPSGLRIKANIAKGAAKPIASF